MPTIKLTTLTTSEAVHRLRTEAELAAITGTAITITVNARQARMLAELLKLGDAASCRITALEEAGLHEIAGHARNVSGSFR